MAVHIGVECWGLFRWLLGALLCYALGAGLLQSELGSMVHRMEQCESRVLLHHLVDGNNRSLTAMAWSLCPAPHSELALWTPNARYNISAPGLVRLHNDSAVLLLAMPLNAAELNVSGSARHYQELEHMHALMTVADDRMLCLWATRNGYNNWAMQCVPLPLTGIRDTAPSQLRLVGDDVVHECEGAVCRTTAYQPGETDSSLQVELRYRDYEHCTAPLELLYSTDFTYYYEDRSVNRDINALWHCDGVKRAAPVITSIDASTLRSIYQMQVALDELNAQSKSALEELVKMAAHDVGAYALRSLAEDCDLIGLLGPTCAVERHKASEYLRLSDAVREEMYLAHESARDKVREIVAEINDVQEQLAAAQGRLARQ